MLLPLKRKKFEELIPLTATSDQYRFYWGKPADVLRRFLISVAGIFFSALIWFIVAQQFGAIILMIGLITGTYWLWSPVYWAGQRNRELRRYDYSGFWQAEVFDVFVTEELVGTEETVNRNGELVIVENRERRLNLELGDDPDFTTVVQVPMKKNYLTIQPGALAEVVIVSNRPDLSFISATSDVYVPDYDLWIRDYPFLRRDVFLEVSRELRMRQSQMPSW